MTTASTRRRPTSWLLDLFRKPRRDRLRKKPLARYRPWVERLEDRWVPANPAVNLDQWANLATAGWQNGNLGQSNSLYAEGQFVPFRLVMTNLVAGHSYTVSIK
jgi:hypothetical protein